jgi:hypothetical protein
MQSCVMPRYKVVVCFRNHIPISKEVHFPFDLTSQRMSLGMHEAWYLPFNQDSRDSGSQARKEPDLARSWYIGRSTISHLHFIRFCYLLLLCISINHLPSSMHPSLLIPSSSPSPISEGKIHLPSQHASTPPSSSRNQASYRKQPSPRKAHKFCT